MRRGKKDLSGVPRRCGDTYVIQFKREHGPKGLGLITSLEGSIGVCGVDTYVVGSGHLQILDEESVPYTILEYQPR